MTPKGKQDPIDRSDREPRTDGDEHKTDGRSNIDQGPYDDGGDPGPRDRGADGGKARGDKTGDSGGDRYGGGGPNGGTRGDASRPRP